MMNSLMKIVCLVVVIVTLIASPAVAVPLVSPPVGINGHGCGLMAEPGYEDYGLECTAGAYVTTAGNPGVYVDYCDRMFYCEGYDLVGVYAHCNQHGCSDEIAGI